jgi:hypothetical protein
MTMENKPADPKDVFCVVYGGSLFQVTSPAAIAEVRPAADQTHLDGSGRKPLDRVEADMPSKAGGFGVHMSFMVGTEEEIIATTVKQLRRAMATMREAPEFEQLQPELRAWREAERENPTVTYGIGKNRLKDDTALESLELKLRSPTRPTRSSSTLCSSRAVPRRCGRRWRWFSSSSTHHRSPRPRRPRKR